MKIYYLLQASELFSKKTNIVGGHIAHIIGVIEAMQRTGHRIIIGSLSKIPYWRNKDITYRLFEIKWLPPFIKGIFKQLQITKQIIRAISEEKPDCIYVRWAPNLFFGRIRKKFPGLPIIIEANATLDMPIGKLGKLEKALFRMTDRSYVKSATIVSAVSRDIEKYIREHYPNIHGEKVVCIPNGVDVNRFKPVESDIRKQYSISPDEIVIGWAGNFRIWHNLDFLIRAFSKLNRANARLMMIGTGQPEIEKQLHELSASLSGERVIFTGPSPFNEMPARLSACDILVSPQAPSPNGVFYQSPIKLYEYMAVGRAIVGARIGQIPEVIQDDKNGLLYNYDSEDDCIRVLRRLVDDPSLRMRLGRAARREAVQSHSWDERTSRLFEILDKIGRRDSIPGRRL